MFSGALTIDEINEKNQTTAYFPFSSNDCVCVARAFAERIADGIDAFMLPVQPFGEMLPGDLLFEAGLDVAEDLKRQGFTRLVLQQSGGPFPALYHLCRHLNAITGFKTAYVDPLRRAADEAQNGLTEREIKISIEKYLRDDDENGRRLLEAGIERSVAHLKNVFGFLDSIVNYTGGR